MRIASTVIVAAGLLLIAVTAHARSKCFPRKGKCVVVTLNGQDIYLGKHGTDASGSGVRWLPTPTLPTDGAPSCGRPSPSPI